MTSALRLEAPAKLNLSLSVTGRRPDGFHELDGTSALIDLADRLLLMPGCAGLRLEGDAAAVPVDPARNLAWRGLRAGLGGEPELACLTVDKRIPAGAGLAGGSADAAAAWRLGRRWRGASDTAAPSELADLAAIGADVPFLASRSAAARLAGVGERVEPLEPADPPLHAILVHPPFALSTAAVFAELREADWTGAIPTADATRAGHNDLLAPALRLRPELEAVFASVTAAGGDPHLTGSGSTVFSLTDDSERATGVARRLRGAGLAVMLARTRRDGASIETIGEADEEEEE
jgi:4-diphosphocytidyl-2-C-methyl-D-erythritol kinase